MAGVVRSQTTLDVAIVGAGIIGLATALALLRDRPWLRLTVVEQEDDVAAHQTGHNSGVLHAGLYYAPGSLKARLCSSGKAEMERYASEHEIPFQRVGKLVIAVEPHELAPLGALFDRGTSNGVPALELVGPERIRELEPHAVGLRGLWSPTTAIIDFRRVAHAFADDVRRQGGVIHVGRRVIGFRERHDGIVLETSTGDLRAAYAIVAAGLWSDKLAALTGDSGTERIVPFRGDYYRLTDEARSLVNGLIYPVPDPRFPFLGVHFTRRIDGEVWAGPNAVLALARDGYSRTACDLREVVGILADPGFRRLTARYWRAGLAEVWRDWSREAFHASLRRFIPSLRLDQLTFGPSGVRAQALDRSGSLIDDFRLGGHGRVIHVRNAPSPAATASLAIGRELARQAAAQFGLS